MGLKGVMRVHDGERFWFSEWGSGKKSEAVYVLHIETSSDHEHQIMLSDRERQDLIKLLTTPVGNDQEGSAA